VTTFELGNPTIYPRRRKRWFGEAPMQYVGVDVRCRRVDNPTIDSRAASVETTGRELFT